MFNTKLFNTEVSYVSRRPNDLNGTFALGKRKSVLINMDKCLINEAVDFLKKENLMIRSICCW